MEPKVTALEQQVSALQQQVLSLKQYFDVAVGTVINWGPKLLAALVLLLLAYIIGKALAYGVQFAFERTPIGRQEKENGEPLGRVLGRAVFWIVILIALPAVLATLGLQGLVQPMQSMAEQFLGFLPNLVGATLIFAIGWAVATVVRRALSSVLEAAQVDKLAAKAGLAKVTGESGVANFLGLLAFTLIIIPVAIAALDTLAIQSISAPAKQMLASFLDAIPNIFAAAIVLLLAFIIGRFASNTLANLLPTLGFDNVAKRIGVMGGVIGESSLSRIAGNIAFFVIMVFGVIEAAKLLDFSIVSELLAEILVLGGHILLGSVIIVFGIVAADFVSEIVKRSKDAHAIAGVLKIAIIILAAAMGLRQMGVANEIINMGFALLLGALAVGAAIAIGWGGKDTAHRLLEKWTKDL